MKRKSNKETQKLIAKNIKEIYKSSRILTTTIVAFDKVYAAYKIKDPKSTNQNGQTYPVMLTSLLGQFNKKFKEFTRIFITKKMMAGLTKFQTKNHRKFSTKLSKVYEDVHYRYNGLFTSSGVKDYDRLVRDLDDLGEMLGVKKDAPVVKELPVVAETGGNAVPRKQVKTERTRGGPNGGLMSIAQSVVENNIVFESMDFTIHPPGMLNVEKFRKNMELRKSNNVKIKGNENPNHNQNNFMARQANPNVQNFVPNMPNMENPLPNQNNFMIQQVVQMTNNPQNIPGNMDNGMPNQNNFVIQQVPMPNMENLGQNPNNFMVQQPPQMPQQVQQVQQVPTFTQNSPNGMIQPQMQNQYLIPQIPNPNGFRQNSFPNNPNANPGGSAYMDRRGNFDYVNMRRSKSRTNKKQGRGNKMKNTGSKPNLNRKNSRRNTGMKPGRSQDKNRNRNRQFYSPDVQNNSRKNRQKFSSPGMKDNAYFSQNNPPGPNNFKRKNTGNMMNFNDKDQSMRDWVVLPQQTQNSSDSNSPHYPNRGSVPQNSFNLDFSNRY